MQCKTWGCNKKPEFLSILYLHILKIFLTKFMECCAVKKQLPEASPSIHLTCHGSSQGKTSMGVVFNVKWFRLKSKYFTWFKITNKHLFSFPFWHTNYKYTNWEESPTHCFFFYESNKKNKHILIFDSGVADGYVDVITMTSSQIFWGF